MSEASDNENEITNYLINDNAEDDPLEKQKMDFDNDLAEVKDEQAEVPRATGTLPRIPRRISIAEPEKAKPKKRVFSLAALLQNNVKSATVEKPIDLNSHEGQRDLIAKKDRELKNRAKEICIDRFSNMDAHLNNWGVSKINYFPN